MRLFIALKLSKETLIKFEKEIFLLRRNVRESIKWVKTNNLHITLKFLGELPENKVTDIKKAMDNINERWQPFKVVFQGVAAFPHNNAPGVLFFNIAEGSEVIKEIHQKLEIELGKYGFGKEKLTFTPHLTFARSRRETDLRKLSKELSTVISDNDFRISENINKISLIKSTLTTDGPIYEEIYLI